MHIMFSSKNVNLFLTKLKLQGTMEEAVKQEKESKKMGTMLRAAAMKKIRVTKINGATDDENTVEDADSRKTEVTIQNENEADLFSSKIAGAYTGMIFMNVCSLSTDWGNCRNHDIDYDHVDKLIEIFEAGINHVNESKQLKITMIKQD